METIKTWIIFSHGWDGFPLAYRLKQEGCDVMVGHVQSKEELGQDDDEKPDEAEARLKQYDGMIEKMEADKLVEVLLAVQNKEDYFIFFDQNNLFPYAQKLVEAGFTKGLFPTEEDFEFEKDRDAAMRFVADHYPEVAIIPHEEFATVAEAIAFLKGANKVYVLQSKGDHVGTMVPNTDDPDAEREQMINQLEKNKSDYEQGGIILKEKLIKPIEITPQIIFYNGVPVFTDLDLETKNIGDGENNGNQVGCGSNLIVKTDLADRINQIAFPPIVYEMANKTPGMFVWDISLYVMPDAMYFGEFCSNRVGYDAVMTEMDMSGGASAFFTSIVELKNPLVKRFGAAVRLFNLNRQKDREIIWEPETDNHIWMYEVYKQDDKIMSLGCCWDLGVATASGDTIQEAVDALYNVVDQISFKELYHKTKHDFLDVFPTSIIFRYNSVNYGLFNAPGHNPEDVKLPYEKKIREMELKHISEMSSLKKQVQDALSDEDEEE
jgi:phosphoribosylamine-glycine ligase